jgi:hypothetical protein
LRSLDQQAEKSVVRRCAISMTIDEILTDACREHSLDGKLYEIYAVRGDTPLPVW